MNLSQQVMAAAGAAQCREWIVRGNPGCVHYWVGTGKREREREEFACSRCGARMSEPLKLSPVRRTRPRAPFGFAPCAVCGGAFRRMSLVRGAIAEGDVCMDCLERIASGAAA